MFYMAHFSTTQDLVARQVEYVHDELGNGITTDPEENGLAILNEEETMSFQMF